MISRQSVVDFHLGCRVLAFSLLIVQSIGLNQDGRLLLSFKHSVLNDPLSVLQTWNNWDENPCSWHGIACSPPGLLDTISRVTAVSLPNSQLLGLLTSDLPTIPHLRILNLSNNSLNGSLPFSLFNASELQFLDLSNNLISGELPEVIGGLKSLQLLNLSDNALAGKIPKNLTTLVNLTAVSLKINYFSGGLPSGFDSIRDLDLSSNLINGSLPPDFGGRSLSYLNISYNRLSGEIPTEFADNVPVNATIDLSFNNLTGEIPDIRVLSNQETRSFSGNPDLCGKLLKKPCTIPSTITNPPNATNTTSGSPPAIAAIPVINSTPDNSTSPSTTGTKSGGLRPGTIVGIVIGDLAGIGIFAVLFLYIYQRKKRKNNSGTKKTTSATPERNVAKDDWSTSPSSSESRGITAWSCLRKKGGDDDNDSSDTTGSDSDKEKETDQKSQQNQRQQEVNNQNNKKGSLVTVDGDKELELETLLKASAYILGATGSSIMYKAVLEDGTCFAVRRIGESGVERFRDFENQVRVIAKLVHPNLVRIRGFYWGIDEKLIIYDFVPNGSLANARYRKAGSSPCPLPWEVRIKIAKGVARGLAYLHEKKHVHGNLKPSNILLGLDMEPKIGDFGLERLVTGESSSKNVGSSRNFGSKRSSASRDNFQDLTIGPSPSPSPSSLGSISAYHAPESLRTLKPNPKWDVYAFGVLLLELLTGKVIVSDELGTGVGLVVEDKTRILRIVDLSIRADVEGKEDTLLACFKLGYSCMSPVSQKRPSMKEVLQVLEKIPSSSSSIYY